MASIKKAAARAGLLPSQLSLRAIMLIFIPFALSLAFPIFGYLAPFAIALFALIAVIVVIVSLIHLIFADDRRAVVALAWEFVRGLLIATILALAYFAYAWLVCDVGYER